VIISVKAGNTGPAHVRDLRGVLDREKAAIGVLITMNDSTKPMRTEAATCGFYETPFGKNKYPRLQILTVQELLDNRSIEMPGQATVATFKKAPKVKKGQTHRQAALDEFADEE